ncbi:TPA: restriction endonuclease subunit S [Enterococcus faecium]|uniref:restriction endonuclease subunit S n=1 Tax=Enterococcus faecium TaxID=1352 RepID=UPI00298EF238|nr:restriction endonuclease subunit S [Enterococcus faecium]MDW7862403.1 restriction endonuclease subunit S [Enterococcus faecium]
MSNDTRPEIRFPGFTEDWEERKLGQVANYRRGSFPQPYGNKEWYDGENSMPFVQVVDVGDNLRLVEDTKQKISELAQPKSVFVEEGKVVVTLQGSIGRVAITQYPAYVDRTLLIFESYKAEMDEYYFAYVIQQLFEYEKTRAPGGTIKTITKEALSNFTISFPSIAEQKKLGKFFEQLDDTIALHQRKLDLLKETKKGFLQKMFPKNGAKVPEVRFPGFTEDWEERKLSELAEVKTGFPFKNDDFIDGGDYLVITNGNIQNNSALVDGNIGNRISAVSDEIKDKYLLNYGDILVTMDGTVGRTAKVFEKNQILAQRVGRLVANTTPEFLYQWLNTGKFFGDMTKVSHGGTIKHISLSEISDFNAFVPVNEDERVKIGSLLLNIDKTITLHQRKLDLLKETKKGFLQKMFV